MPHTIVIFGASGDLTSRKLVPALYNLFRGGTLPADTRVVGYSRTPMSDDAWRASLRETTAKHAEGEPFDEKAWGEFAPRIHYQPGDIGVSADVGVRATAPARSALAGGSIDLFAFARRADGLVAYERSGLGYVRPYNVGAARVLGLELLASYRAARWVRAELAATLLDPRDVSPDRVTANALLPYQPRLIAVPRVELSTRAPLPGVAEAKLAASYFYSASRYADAAGLVVLPAQQSLDVEGEVSLLGEHLAVRGRVANVLDQARTDLIGYPLPGRAAYLALEGRL